MDKIQASDLIARMHAMALQAQQKVVLSQDISVSAPFSNVLNTAISKVNQEQVQANQLAEAFEKGESVELSDVMIASQKSNLAFQAMVQVRNRLVNAYQEIMNMPI